MITREVAYQIAKQEVPCLEHRKWYSLKEEDSGNKLNIYCNITQGTAFWQMTYSNEYKYSTSNVIGACMGLAISKADGRVLFHGLITDEG